MTMCGALMQLLPVVAGAELPWPAASARAIHALLCVGTALLAGGFWWTAPTLFALALAPLLLALAWLLCACTWALLRAPKDSGAAMLGGVRPALLALAGTVPLGAAMAAAMAWPRALPLADLVGLHASWGLLGWVALLIVGVAFQVIPMFQVTPPYPPLVTLLLSALLPATLLASSAAQASGHWSAPLLRAVLAALFTLFALWTFSLLARRKRPADATTLFWRASMGSLLACVLLWYAPLDTQARAIATGVLFMLGFAGSAVMGMLYKIVPFLLWQHWQERGLPKPLASIRLVIPDGRAKAQFWLHLASLMLLVGAVPLAAWQPHWPAQPRPPHLALAQMPPPHLPLRVGALALMASAALLGASLARAALIARAAQPLHPREPLGDTVGSHVAGRADQGGVHRRDADKAEHVALKRLDAVRAEIPPV